MSITLITGIPGSGKTLFAVNELKKFIEQNNVSDDPCNIYCDITGLKISDIPPPPLDWRETPPRSLLIYDEAQFHDEFKAGRGLTKYKQVEEMTIHRKTGHKLWFVTQDPSRLHNDILAMVEIHYHLERPYGAKLATIYQYRGAERKPSGVSVKQRAESKKLFNYDKRLFDLYESSQVDDGIKFRLPRELTVWVILAVIVGVYFYTQVTSDGMQKYLNMASGESAETAETQDKQTAQDSTKTPPQPSSEGQGQPPAPPPPSEADKLQGRRVYYYQKWLSPDYELIKSEQNLQVRGVMKMRDKCIAYNTHGDMMTLTKDECNYYIAQTGRVHRTNQHTPSPHNIKQDIPPNKVEQKKEVIDEIADDTTDKNL